MLRGGTVSLCRIAAVLFTAIAARAPPDGLTGVHISEGASLLQVVSHRSLDGQAIVADVAAGGRAAKGTRSIRALKRSMMRAAIARHNDVDNSLVPEAKDTAKKAGQLMRAEPKSSMLQIGEGITYRDAVALARTDGPAEQIEPYKDSHKAVSSSLDPAELRNLSASITKQVYSDTLHKIADHQRSRFVADDGNPKSAHLIEGMFKDYGLNVRQEPLEMSAFSQYVAVTDTASDSKDEPLSNVIAYLPGTGKLKNEAVLLGAHFDSVNWRNTKGKSPGVDDNGSGSAAIQAAAKVLAEYAKRHPPSRTIVFAAFNGEEEGLIGSAQFVKSAKEHGTYGDIKYAVVLDEVAWSGRNKKERSAIFETKGDGSDTNALVDTFHKCWNVTADHDGVSSFVVNKHGFGSDHISFLDAGIPSVLLIERDDDYHSDTFGHSQDDTFEHVDIEFGASMTRLATRVIATLAWPAA